MNNWAEAIITGMCLIIGFFILLMSVIRIGDTILNCFIGPHIRAEKRKESEEKI